MAGRDILNKRFKGFKIRHIELYSFDRAAICFNMRARNIELLLTTSANHDLCPATDKQSRRGQANPAGCANQPYAAAMPVGDRWVQGFDQGHVNLGRVNELGIIVARQPAAAGGAGAAKFREPAKCQKAFRQFGVGYFPQ